MAKWGVPSTEAELAELQEKYDSLLKAHQELQATVNCDYYEAYLREKKRRESLEADLMISKEPYQSKVDEKQVRNVAGWEYYGD